MVSTRLGVLDVGSNTVHLLVVDAHRGARPTPMTSENIELRLPDLPPSMRPQVLLAAQRPA